MKISSIAKSNFKGNFYRYVMYILSNAFAVFSVFIFLNFLLHPEIDHSGTYGVGGTAAAAAKIAIMTSVIITLLFSVLFIGYATSLFIKSRGKEFGLLSLYGMTKNQIRKYVFIENSIIGVLSLIIGILSGMALSKLFLMMMDRFVKVGLYFYISPIAIIITSVLFLVIFQVLNFLNLLKISDKEIVEQLKSSRKPRTLKKFSKFKAILGIVLLAIGYIIAWIVYGGAVILAMIPVTMIVIFGTYFLVTQFSMYFIDKLNKNTKLKNKGTNIISFSQISFKLQDTAKILFLSAILGAVTFTATETIFTFYNEADYVFGYVSTEDIVIGDFNLTEQDRYEEIVSIVENKMNEVTEIKDKYEVEFLRANNQDFEKGFQTRHETSIIKESDYNKVALMYDFGEIKVSDKEVFYIYPHIMMGSNPNDDEILRIPDAKVRLKVNDFEDEFIVNGEQTIGAISLPSLRKHDYFVVSDDLYEEMREKYSNEYNISNITGIRIDNKTDAYEASIELLKDLNLPDERSSNVFFKAIPHVETRSSFGLIMFMGFFIAFLFMLATGSIIYFKLFDEIKQDRQEYLILRKIGITDKELNNIITKQIALIFFIPFVISTIHSLVALKSLSSLVQINLIRYGVLVMIGYGIFQLIYFLIIRRSYIKNLDIL